MYILKFNTDWMIIQVFPQIGVPYKEIMFSVFFVFLVWFNSFFS